MNKGALALSINIGRKNSESSIVKWRLGILSLSPMLYPQYHGICNSNSNALGGNKMANVLSYPTQIEVFISMVGMFILETTFSKYHHI